MTFYNEKEHLYLEIDASSIGLGASLLQVRNRIQFPRHEASHNAAIWLIAFVSKSLTSSETQYSKGSPRHIEWHRELPSLLFHHEVSMIIHHKLLLAIFKKDVASLSQRLQRLLLQIHQYSRRILYKPKPKLFIVVWLSRHNHKINRDEVIPGMNITINVIHTLTRLHDSRRN